MGKDVTPFSFKRNIFGQIEEPEYAVDKILSFTLYHIKCPSCGFNNQFEIMEICPFCGQNLILMKEDNYETIN